jgi:hypothetical protein
MGVAVSLEDEARRGSGGGALDLGREPDLAGAAANSVRLRVARMGLRSSDRETPTASYSELQRHGFTRAAGASAKRRCRPSWMQCR